MSKSKKIKPRIGEVKAKPNRYGNQFRERMKVTGPWIGSVSPIPGLSLRLKKWDPADEEKDSFVKNPDPVEKISRVDKSLDGCQLVIEERTSIESLTKQCFLGASGHQIYPGALYRCADLLKNKTMNIARKPMDIHIAGGEGWTGPVTTQVKDPNSSTIASAIQYLTQSFDIRNASVNTWANSHSIDSKEDWYVKTGGRISFLGSSVSVDYEYGKTTKSYKYYSEIIQTYYTVRVGDNVRGLDFFVLKEEAPDNNKAISVDQITNDIVYVDSVTYGRMAYLVLECESELETHNLKIEAVIELLIGDSKEELSISQKNFLQESALKVIAVGADAGNTALLVSDFNPAEFQKNWNNWLANPGNGPGSLLGYQLKSLDGSDVVFLGKYDFSALRCVKKVTGMTWNYAIHYQGSRQYPKYSIAFGIAVYDGKGNKISVTGGNEAGDLVSFLPPLNEYELILYSDDLDGFAGPYDQDMHLKFPDLDPLDDNAYVKIYATCSGKELLPPNRTVPFDNAEIEMPWTSNEINKRPFSLGEKILIKDLKNFNLYFNKGGRRVKFNVNIIRQ